MAYLQIDHVDKVFTRGSTRSEVLKGINLTVEKGDYVSIIGHSGCGKSTLLNIVAGLTDATQGGVLREGREGTRAGLKAMFAEFPENRAEIVKGYQLGEYAVLHERVFRSSSAEPFEVMSIYSFEDDKCSRVEFVR